MEKQFHAWAVLNPSLSVPPLVTLKSVGCHVPLQLLISPTQRGTSDPLLGTPVQLLGNSTWQKRNVFRHLDVVRWLEVQTKNQNKEERGFKWLWTWNGCWWFASWMCSRQICSNCVMRSCQYGPKSLRNFSNTLLNLCHEELRQFWRQKGVQPSTRKVYLIKWLVSVCPLCEHSLLCYVSIYETLPLFVRKQGNVSQSLPLCRFCLAHF